MAQAAQGISRIQIRTKKTLKDQATELFDKLGLDMGTAINMFLAQSVRDGGLPFRASLTPLERDIDEVEPFASESEATDFASRMAGRMMDETR
ncbi:type II toxin-antitoxin system RelB/DinJ family antitoxin [Bifidobacterium sp. ESL0764]|uniref:type II toxin-antitoxin system RelB/DinJ family antitoxin n=1 Tax=Bifidobacterium sp. ESL0764 TaxID=2983228 RepID=UPI0023F7AAB0|nr:type II toxin-antitoxin system RelB/DinJ family antitoxin [Bifidobacterium sp. ESL0764]WEV65581.1 type II toxin-antitoxin system RelB/DinJ family antitoxin [Bifidobacterium sp. ESL0764]